VRAWSRSVSTAASAPTADVFATTSPPAAYDEGRRAATQVEVAMPAQPPPRYRITSKPALSGDGLPLTAWIMAFGTAALITGPRDRSSAAQGGVRGLPAIGGHRAEGTVARRVMGSDTVRILRAGVNYGFRLRSAWVTSAPLGRRTDHYKHVAVNNCEQHIVHQTVQNQTVVNNVNATMSRSIRMSYNGGSGRRGPQRRPRKSG